MILKKRLIVIFTAGSFASVDSMNRVEENSTAQRGLEPLKEINTALNASGEMKLTTPADKAAKMQAAILKFSAKLGISTAGEAVCAVKSATDADRNAKIEEATTLIHKADVVLEELCGKYKKNLNHDGRMFFEILRQRIISLKIALGQAKLQANKLVAHKVEGDEVSTPEEV